MKDVNTPLRVAFKEAFAAIDVNLSVTDHFAVNILPDQNNSSVKYVLLMDILSSTITNKCTTNYHDIAINININEAFLSPLISQTGIDFTAAQIISSVIDFNSIVLPGFQVVSAKKDRDNVIVERREHFNIATRILTFRFRIKEL